MSNNFDAVKSQHLGKILIDQGVISPETLQKALCQQQHQQKVAQEKNPEIAAASIMVASEKLDHLANLVGDLITSHARISTLNDQHETETLTATLRSIGQRTNQIRNSIIETRKMPFGSLISHFKRLVINESEKRGCQINFQIDGPEMEFDKTMLEKLETPLSNLLSFCIQIDQEPATHRENKGKTSFGKVSIKCISLGTEMRIVIQSDGNGLSEFRDSPIGNESFSESIHEFKEEIVNVSSAERSVDPRFELNHLFNSRQIRFVDNEGTEIDLSAVRQIIEDLHGTISATGTFDEGIKIVVTVPQNIAIIQGLLVRIARRHFILPFSAINECVLKPPAEKDDSKNYNIILVRGKPIPCFSLRNFFGIEEECNSKETMIITKIDRQQIGFSVDLILDEIKTVVKPLGHFLSKIKWFQGTAILGNGHIAMVLNLARIIRSSKVLNSYSGLQHDRI